MQIKTLRSIILKEVLKTIRTGNLIPEIVSGRPVNRVTTLRNLEVGDVFQILEDSVIWGSMNSSKLSFKKYSGAYYLVLSVNRASILAAPVSGYLRQSSKVLSYKQAINKAAPGNSIQGVNAQVPEDIAPADGAPPIGLKFSTSKSDSKVRIVGRWNLGI